jgi:CRP/FNR family transcriptional regulator, cyclic AMP receptor protein
MPAVQDPDALAAVPLFQNLKAAQLSKLNALLHRKSFGAGYNIITAEQPGETIYIISSGSVKVYSDEAHGSEVILAILGAGEVVGEMSLADSLGRSATVVTLEQTDLLWMDRANFWTSLREMPEMAHNLVSILSRRLRLANNHARSLAALDVQGRVAGQLLAFAREYGEPTPDGGLLIPLRLTQTDLAALVGASRVRVNQALGFHRRNGHISVDADRRFVVHDAPALARRAL